MQKYPQATKDKAFSINQDPNVYGSFAEIGAGQEVGRWFFRVGGASSTVAKTISAYDMVFSDAIYGAEESKRYVCESRLLKMLQREFRLLQERLTSIRPKNKFFAFADTVAAKSSKVSSNCHGWLGVRFQTKPGGEYNDLVVHTRMLDSRNYLQQEALGTLGVNMIYAVFYLLNDPHEIVRSLMDGIERGRLEIDLVKFSGPDVGDIDNRKIGLNLVQSGFTDAVLITPEGSTEQPSDILYGKSVLIQRGNFNPVNLLTQDMLTKGKEAFQKDFKLTDAKTMVLPEMNIGLETLTPGLVDSFLQRAELLGVLGYPVLISKFKHYSELRQLLNRCHLKHLGINMGIGHLHEIFEESRFEDIEGGLLEALGKLLNNNVKLYIYPAHSLSTTEPEKKGQSQVSLYSIDNFVPVSHLKPLLDFFIQTKKIVSIPNPSPDALEINSKSVYQSVLQRKLNWEQQLPSSVAKLIQKKKLFLS